MPNYNINGHEIVNFTAFSSVLVLKKKTIIECIFSRLNASFMEYFSCNILSLLFSANQKNYSLIDADSFACCSQGYSAMPFFFRCTKWAQFELSAF